MQAELTDQRWLVTGGTRGLGKVLVHTLAQRGARVVTCGRTEESAARARAEVPAELADRVLVVAADLTQEADVDRLFDLAAEQLDGLDVVVNNAGVLHDALVVGTTLAQWEAVLATNLRAPFLVLRGAVAELLGGAGGAIINVSSAAANGIVGQAAYAASKAGLLSMSRAVAKEYGARGIRCNAVVPGFFESDMTQELDPDLRSRYEALSPEHRFGTPEELVEAILFLAGPEARFVTGDELWVCGTVHSVPRVHR